MSKTYKTLSFAITTYGWWYRFLKEHWTDHKKRKIKTDKPLPISILAEKVDWCWQQTDGMSYLEFWKSDYTLDKSMLAAIKNCGPMHATIREEYLL